MQEIYKDIPGYEGLYQVSNLGNVKSFKWNKQRVLKPIKDKRGYCGFGLCKESVLKKHNAHRLVAIEFIPNPNNLEVVNHIDSDKSNNRESNLEWTSSLENNVHSFKNKKTYSKYCGVTFDKNTKKWKSSIRINKKAIHLGTYSSEIEAYNSRVNFEKKNGIKNKYL